MPVQYEKYEIVGFVGDVSLPCASATPIGRETRRDIYFRPALRFHTEEELGIEGGELNSHRGPSAIQHHFSDSTMLPNAVPMVPHARMVYATESFLKDADFLTDEAPTDSFDGLALSWQSIDRIPKVWITYASAETIDKLMSHWATGLKDSAESQLRDHYSDGDGQHLDEAQRLAEYGLCAAHGPDLRWSLYLTLAVSKKDEEGAVDRIWGEHISGRIPGKERATFDKGVEELEAKLK